MAAVTQAQGLRNNLLFAKIVCGYMATIAIYIYGMQGGRNIETCGMWFFVSFQVGSSLTF